MYTSQDGELTTCTIHKTGVSGIPGVVCMIDDILASVWQGENQSLRGLTRLVSHSTQINVNFLNKVSKFMGHVIDEMGIHPDPNKIQAIQQIKAPTNSYYKTASFLRDGN